MAIGASRGATSLLSNALRFCCGASLDSNTGDLDLTTPPAAVYATLDRLEAKGFVRSKRVGAEGPTRRLFEVTAAGARALTETNTMRERLWEGISVRVLTALGRA